MISEHRTFEKTTAEGGPTRVKTSICPWDFASEKASAVRLAINRNSIAPSQSWPSWQCRETISAPVLQDRSVQA